MPSERSEDEPWGPEVSSNTIVAGEPGSRRMVDNNLTWGNAQGGVGGSRAGQVTNNRNVDPQFSDARYHVADSSPAKDGARAPFSYFSDLDGVPRVIGANPDLGAYER